MSETLKLPESGTEDSWDVPFTYSGQTLDLTLTEALVRQEIRDQCDLKKPARKAILRATEKRLARNLKKPYAALSAQARDDLRWDLFIVLIDKAIAGRHLQIRDDATIATAILESAMIRPG